MAIYARLVGYHLTTLSAWDQRALVGRVLAGPAVNALMFRSSARRLRERLHTLQEIVCIPCGASPDITLLAFWAGLHMTCCLQEPAGLLGREPGPGSSQG